MPSNRRIKLLSETEVDEIYQFPIFNEVEQALYFEFSKQEIAIAKGYGTTKTRIYFLLSLGYFKAKQQFYHFDLSASQDTAYIHKRYFENADNTLLTGQIDSKTYKKQTDNILKLFKYQTWSSLLESEALIKLCELLRCYPKGHNALRQLLNYLEKKKIVFPTYRKFQDIFSTAFALEESRLHQLLFSIPSDIQELLIAIIKRDDGISQFNLIRADQKDFQYTAIKSEVKKATLIINLYVFSKEFLPTLKLSKNAIRYYADIAEQYSASRLRKLNQTQQWLHVICFIFHRYQQIMNNLITSFMYHVKSIMDAGKSSADIAFMEHSAEIVVDFPKLSQFLTWFPARDEKLTYSAMDAAAYKILPKAHFSELAQFFDGNTFDKKAAQWQFYFKSRRLFALYLRPILLAVDFLFYKKDAPIIDLINLIKNHHSDKKPTAALKLPANLQDAIPENIKQYLKRDPEDDELNSSLLEFFVYQKMYHQLNRGRLFCNDSIDYCDIDQDLVDDATVDNVHAIAHKFGYPKIPIYCDKRLEDAVSALNEAWETTTKNIQSGKNTDFNLKKPMGSEPQDWSLLYDSSEPLDTTFFKTLPKVGIADVIMFVGELVDLWDGFTHMKGRYVKREKPMRYTRGLCTHRHALCYQ